MANKKPGVKLLLTGLSSSGKTNALKTLDPKTSFVISIDGKHFPFPIPHANFSSFPDVNSFINGYESEGQHVDGIIDKISKFKEVTGKLPETIAVDTVSRVFQIIADNCSQAYKGFTIHSMISKEIAQFNQFLEITLVSNGMNVVSTTHVMLNPDTGTYEDASSGAYRKSGGAISVHDHVSFFHIVNKQYMVTHRSPGLPCRTLLSKDVLPDSQPADEYSLANHIKLLAKTNDEVEKFVF